MKPEPGNLGVSGGALDGPRGHVRNATPAPAFGPNPAKTTQMPKAIVVALFAAGIASAVPAATWAQPTSPSPGNAPSRQAKPDASEPSQDKVDDADVTGDTPKATDDDQSADNGSETGASNSLDLPSETAPVVSPATAEPGKNTATSPTPIVPVLPSVTPEMATSASDAEPKSSDATETSQDNRAFAEDWWSHARPILELHGYFRTRAELFHNFSLGRVNAPGESLWAPPSDNRYTGLSNSWGPLVCSPDNSPCKNKTQSSANLRFRLNPELHVSDNLRVISQIDLLDNLVLGSTPAGYANQPAAGGGYSVITRSGYSPLSLFDNTTEPPSAGINGYKDSVRVKRVWGEYSTPVGQLRFGRMPDHFGLGMYHNAGDGYDDDEQSTIDRILFITNFEALDLYVGGSWDFPNEGATSESLQSPGAQPYDLAQLDDVDQLSLIILHQKSPQLQRLALTRGELLINGGAYVQYRTQTLANDLSGACAANTDTPGAAALGCGPGTISAGYVRRNATIWTPDLWMQLLYKHFRFDAEAVTIQGKMDNSLTDGYDYETAPGSHGWRFNAWGVATQLQQKLLEDRLQLGFDFGWASGDPDVDKTGLQGSSSTERGDLGLQPGTNGLQRQVGDHTFSTFRFHPSYRVDLILHRNLLTRVQGTYYFRPNIAYDFVRKPDGLRLGGAFAGIWSRASEFVQAPGHKRDLGIELNGTLYFQSKDGVLNDRPGTLGGFYTMIQYGVMFPLDGLGYPADVGNRLNTQLHSGAADLSTPQILRWYLGVFF